MASNHQIQNAVRDTNAAAAPAVATNKETALLTRRQTDLANRGQANEQALLNASAKTFFAAIAPDAIVSY